ncbi:MAG: ABC transporter substrate-binding protein [Proteobacteria bacterium]|nr:ABC transporter substrate-binding protein [Pseudomonadota bacterium]
MSHPFQGGCKKAACLAALPLALTLAGSYAHAETTLRLVPQADLKVLDTVWTTNNITSNHGYMVYDVLFAPDGKLVYQPQMVESYEKSADGLTWKFTLRPGLKFHDGTPAEAKDVVATMKRWASRIPTGKTLMQFGKEIVATGTMSFELRLAQPFGPVLDTLGTPENPLFITREKEAMLPADQPIEDPTGSGPYIMVKNEWVPGAKVVYRKNPDYVPRKEPADGFAGGKLAKVDRVEWPVIPDANTATQALIRGEVDMIEIPTPDLLPLMRKEGNITIKVIDRIGTQAVFRPNHLQKPFDNPKVRQALLYMVGDQKDYLGAMIGNPEYEKPCWAVFVCGTPLESKAGIGPWATNSKADNIAKAKALLAEAGYKGERVVVLDPADTHLAHTQATVTAQKMREIGINVDLQSVDWGTQTARRALKDPLDANPRAWTGFHTWGGGLAMGTPLTNTPAPTPCDGSNWFGWPCDAALEKIRLEYPLAQTDAQRKDIVDRFQARFYETVPYIPIGQFYAPIAYRNNLTGVLETVRLVLWNIEKKG